MFAVGIDVSNGRSMVAVLQSRTNVTLKPFEVAHTLDGLSHLAEMLNALDGDVRVVMEHTGRYYESVAQFLHGAGFFVSSLNPLLIREYGGGTLRRVKTDKADAVKIARFALDNWEELRQYRAAMLGASKSYNDSTASVLSACTPVTHALSRIENPCSERSSPLLRCLSA